MTERHSIYLRRTSGAPKPWTKDPLLQQYRFCNVYRALDTESAWLREWIRSAAGTQAWFAALVFRHINRHQSFRGLPYPSDWSAARGAYQAHFRQLQAAGEQVFSGAYMINQSVPGGRGMYKADYLIEFVFDKAWASRARLAPTRSDCLASFHERLTQLKGLGSFMAAQVVADAKHWPGLLHAPDWLEWAAPGPGSLRGLNRVCSRDPATRWNVAEWEATLDVLRTALNKRIPRAWQRIDGQDTQNCLCEFDKYQRGYSRTKYPGAR